MSPAPKRKDVLTRGWPRCGLAAQVNPKIFFEVFIHKVDGLSDDHKRGTASTNGAGY